MITRLDMVGRPGSTWTAALALLPERRDRATLGTFDPPESTASITRHVVDVSVGGTNPIKGTLALETLAHVKVHGVTVRGQGTAPMEFFPAGRRGNYFNDQQRDAWSAQWRSAVSGVRQHLAGTHFFKAGGDVLFASSREHSTYRPVLIKRADDSLARAIVFEPSDGTARSAWDVTVFAQDRWQPRSSLLVDAGLRMDRSGVIGTTTVSPRIGVRVGLGPRDRVTLGAGVGRFVEATPLVIASTDALAARTVTDFDAFGRQAGDRRHLVPRFGASSWQAPRALTWHVESEWRIVSTLTLRALGTVRDPIVRSPAYGPSAADAPNRVVGQVRGGTGPWRAAATFEFRDGFPFYAVDQMQEYVGLPRPAGRRTRVIALDAIAERRLRVGRLRPWVGLQVLNVLGRFNPRDVQTNVASADFGTMYDSERRRVRLTLRF
ncbi:MAG: TonB-dependent receptor [Acidobacteria bacterium]|nr:TonB-dependent receptor [Acidobacteriota bacterium]